MLFMTSCRDSIQSTVDLGKAQSMLANQRYEEAIEYYDQVIESKKFLPKAYSGKAEALVALESIDEAIKCCDVAISLDPNHHWAYNIKGNAYYAADKYEESLEFYKKAASLDPDESLYQNNIACSLNSLNRFDEAIEYCDKALQLNPKNDSAYSNKAFAKDGLGKKEEALSLYDKALQIHPRSLVDLVSKGYLLNDLGKFESALEAFDKALRISPNYLDALYGKATSLNLLEKYEEALKCYDSALEKFPDNVDIVVYKASTLYEQEEYEKSIELCDKALTLDPNHVDALLWKAKNYINLEDTQKAIDLCDAVSKKEKDNSTCQYIKGLAYFNDYKYNDAIKQFEKAIEMDTLYEDPYINKIYTLYIQKNYEKCIEFSQKAFEVFPNNSDFPWYAANSYSMLLDTDNAIKQYETVLKMEPEAVDIMNSIAWEYYYAQEYDQASTYMKKSLKISPKDESALEIKKLLEEQKLPESHRIADFVKENYLYLDDIKEFDKTYSEFKTRKKVTTVDINNFIESIRKKDDMFTFVISGEDYDLLKSEEMESQVFASELSSDINYIKIDSFTQSVSWEFRKTIDSIKNPENKVLVIDLRDNTGGLTSASNDILDFLLPECTTSYIVYRDGYIYSYESDKNQLKFKKILVLVNENSASSSEVLALGLKKYLPEVVIMGQPTVGKGVGQITYEDKSKKYMIFLVSFYWNVKEKNIMGERINPDIYVKGNEEAFKKKILEQARK